MKLLKVQANIRRLYFMNLHVYLQAPRCVAGAAAQQFSAKSHCAPAAHAARTTLRETASKATCPIQRKDRNSETGENTTTTCLKFASLKNHHVRCAGNCWLEIACFLGTMDFFRCLFLIEVKIDGFFFVECFDVKKKHPCPHQSINPPISSVQFGPKPTHLFLLHRVGDAQRSLPTSLFPQCFASRNNMTSTGNQAELLKGRHQRSVVKGIDLGFMMDSLWIQMDSVWIHYGFNMC